jgi:tetratricopeptide (TPR) repeat protein
MMRMKFSLYLLMFILSGCGFTSGQYKDILQAQEYIENSNFEKAIKIYKNILASKPTKNIAVKINYQLGEIHSIYLNNYQEALKNYQEVIGLASEPLWQVKALERIGAINYENLKNYSVSKSVYDKLVKFVPRLQEQDFYKFRYALSIFNQDDYENATKIFKELSIESKTEYGIESYYYLGLVYFYQKKWDTAITYWFESLKRETNKDRIVQIKFMIANAYENSEQLKEAYNIYYSLVGVFPNSEVIRNRLKSLYDRRVARKR